MKKHFKNMAFLLAVLAIVLCAAVQPHDTQAATPKLNKTTVTLVKGDQISLKVTGTAKKVRWSTSKKKVATVTSKGLVKAKSKGTTRIAAKVGKKKLVCRVTIEAPKLNKSGLTVGIGKTAALKLTGTKGRVKWYTTDPNIATVTQNGAVRGIGVGSCRVYAHVRGRGFPCVVSVRNLPPADPTWVPTPNPTITPGDGFNEGDAKDNVTYESHRTDNGVIVIAKNNYKFSMHLKMDVLYYNSSGTMIGKTSDYCYVLEPGRETVLHAINPYDSSYNKVDYSRYEVVFACEEARAIGNANNISCEANFGSGNVMATVKNLGGYAEFTSIGVVFYKNGGIIGYEEHFADVKKSGATDYLQFDFPYDSEYNTITPDNFRIFVNYSYRYNF